jgi:hypothetical protein
MSSNWNPMTLREGADTGEKFRLFWFLTERRGRHMNFIQSCRPDMTDNGHRAKVPENVTNIILSRKKCKLINGHEDEKPMNSQDVGR